MAKRTPEQLAEMRAWLINQGFDAKEVSLMTDQTVGYLNGKCHESPAYLAACMRRRGKVSLAFEPATHGKIGPIGRVPTTFDEMTMLPSTLLDEINKRRGPEMDLLKGLFGDDVHSSPSQLYALKSELDDTQHVMDVKLGVMTKRLDMQVQALDAMVDQLSKRGAVDTVILNQGFQVELPKDGAYHVTFPELLGWVSAGENVMLVGPAGSGKTTACKQVAEVLGLPFYHTGAVASEFKLSGHIGPTGEYHGTTLRQAVEHGGVYLFDEYDASVPAATMFLQTLLAGGACAFPDKIVEPHPDFHAVAACNTYGYGRDRVYVGRNQQDGAALDRFVVLDWDYDEELEKCLFGNDEITAKVQKIRARVFEAKMRYVVSPRATKAYHAGIAAGLPKERVENATIWKGMSTDDRAKIEKLI